MIEPNEINSLFDDIIEQLNGLEVEIINPVRKDDIYKRGRICGFKPGIYGGGHSNYRNGVPHSFSSDKMKWIKKPKVLVVYAIFTYGKSEHMDWIHLDNCIFTKKEIKDDILCKQETT